MKRYILILVLLLMTAIANGGMTNSATDIEWGLSNTYMDTPANTLKAFTEEAGTIIENWTLEDPNTLTMNTVVIDANSNSNAVTFTINSEDLAYTYGTNSVSVSSSTGVVLIDWGTVVPKADQMLFDPVSAAVGTVEGTVYYDSDDDNLYVRTTAGLVDLTAGAGSPAGSDTQLQYNDNGSFGAISSVIWDDTNLEIADDVRVAHGTDADWLESYEEADDDTYSLQTANTASADVDIGMMTVAVDTGNSGCTANQEVFEIGKGAMDDSLANFTELFSVDEDGDVYIEGTLTINGGYTDISTATLSSTGTTTFGDGTGTVAVNSSSWDITTAGAASGITTLSMSGDLTLSAGDAVFANGKGIKSSTTTAETIDISAYDVDNTTYRSVIALTNGDTIALTLGTNYETVAINSSDWDIGTTGNMSGMGSLAMDGALSISNASPTININDSDATAGDDNITLVGAATDTGDGSEDVDFAISQQIAGTLRAVATFDADGNITLGYGTQNVVATADVVVTGSDLSLGTAGVKLTGDGDGAITLLSLGDGENEDLIFNLDDTADEGTVTSSTGLSTVNFSAIDVRAADLESSTATPSIEFYDSDCGDGDMSAQILVAATTTASGSEDIDVTHTQQVDGSDHDYIASDADGNLTLDSGAGTINMTDTVVFNGGQTRKVRFDPKVVELDGTNPPTLSDHGTDAQCNISALQFAATGAADDDICYISWLVPDGYVTDSARLNVCYTFSDAEDEADEAQFDFAVNAVAAGETLDAAGTALADQTTVITDGTADNGKLHTTQYNIEVEDIAVDDLVTVEVAVDNSASALANSGTLDVLYLEIEYESTE